VVAPTVGVIGLRALNRDAKRLCADTGPLNKALSDAGKKASAPILAAVRSSVPKDSGALGGSARVTASRSGAAVRMGRASVPYAGPVDFGGWPGDRGYEAGGRYLFPAGQRLAGTAATLYAAGCDRAFAAFDWTNATTTAEAVHD
jgi:hypothetical protein